VAVLKNAPSVAKTAQNPETESCCRKIRHHRLSPPLPTLPAVFWSEKHALSFIQKRIAKAPSSMPMSRPTGTSCTPLRNEAHQPPRAGYNPDSSGFILNPIAWRLSSLHYATGAEQKRFRDRQPESSSSLIRHDPQWTRSIRGAAGTLYKTRTLTGRPDLCAGPLILGRCGCHGHRHPKDEQSDPAKWYPHLAHHLRS
jgi:hypothetical protein